MNIYNKNWAQYEFSYNLANSRENWAPPQKIASRCHGECSIPKLLYPHTKFPSERCTPVHDSLVDPVRGYNGLSIP